MIARRGLAGVVFVAAAVVLVGALSQARRGRAPAGNAVVVVNAGGTGLDSIVIAPDRPGEAPGAPRLAARRGYVAPMDSAWIALPAATGDADVRAWRGGRVVANHVAYFGGRSLFEVRVGDSAQVGRYRRMR